MGSASTCSVRQNARSRAPSLTPSSYDCLNGEQKEPEKSGEEPLTRESTDTSGTARGPASAPDGMRDESRARRSIPRFCVLIARGRLVILCRRLTLELRSILPSLTVCECVSTCVDVSERETQGIDCLLRQKGGRI